MGRAIALTDIISSGTLFLAHTPAIVCAPGFLRPSLTLTGVRHGMVA